jgi:hypothetical protein
MSWLRNLGGIGALGCILASLGCGGSTTTAPSATAQTYTEVFTGNVTQGAVSFGTDNQNHFTVHVAGNITATITKLAPLSTITIGLALGVYDASTSTCSLQLFGDAAKLNLALAASVGVAGELCVGVYDVGNITDPVDYEVTILHT